MGCPPGVDLQPQSCALGRGGGGGELGRAHGGGNGETTEFRFPSAPTIPRGLIGTDIFLQSCDLLRTCSGFSLK